MSKNKQVKMSEPVTMDNIRGVVESVVEKVVESVVESVVERVVEKVVERVVERVVLEIVRREIKTELQPVWVELRSINRKLDQFMDDTAENFQSMATHMDERFAEIRERKMLA